MRKILLAYIIIVLTSCSTKYVCESNLDTPIFSKKTENSNILFVVPKNNNVTIIGKSRRFKKIKYEKIEGWTNSENLIFIRKDNKLSNKNSSRQRESNYNTTSSGSVHVKGYYRKDGTYVKPHNRSSPKSSRRR